jgi:hypothetical protein
MMLISSNIQFILLPSFLLPNAYRMDTSICPFQINAARN